MKLPFLNKNHSTSSYSSNSNSNSSSSSWPWPSCNQNPKTLSFRATITFTNPIHDQDDDELDPPEIITESVENVIKGLRSSERLIFESKGETNSILEEATSKREEEEDEEEGFMLISLESNDPYSDFKRSMEEMVEAHALHHDWKSLEKLLLQFLKVNAKTSHRYIFAAFVDLLMNLALNTKKPITNSDISKDDGVSASRAAAAGEASTSCCNSIMTLGESPSSPLSFYTSCSSSSSSDETSSTSVRFLPLSSLLEMDENTKDIMV
ncbi:Ovate protein family C-terminal [Arabidopsis thaliana x Arabidopsis arenosa]|uniref:Transcription repressor n=1 Tax=Arabidopsis thaliana x Arabidopsis arenosa TaxID=1240361 RepID=A0A8T2ACF7_9BRAS|nr:Ovate protein family C-terminal [Arabidopsis thaliana x Arabidopsis arenosa]